jgi:nitroreductase
MESDPQTPADRTDAMTPITPEPHPNLKGLRMLKDMLKPISSAAQITIPDEASEYLPDIVDGVMRSRKSIRAFLPKSVDMNDVRDILQVAARAPSGTNIQPWHAVCVDKAGIKQVHQAVRDSGIKPERAKWSDYEYYPQKFVDPYLERRKQLGAKLYGLIGLSKRDIPAMRAQFDRNYKFFDAPVGIFITIDRDLAVGSWLDLGMFIQNVLLAAQARGIASCPIAAFAPFHDQVRQVVDIPDQHILVCGIALGYADNSKPENQMHTPRAPLNAWTKFPESSATTAPRSTATTKEDA